MSTLNFNFETINNNINGMEKTFLGNSFEKFQTLDGKLTPYQSSIDKNFRKKLQSLRPTTIDNEEQLLKIAKNISNYNYIKVSNGFILNSGLKNQNKYIYIFISDSLIKEIKEQATETTNEVKEQTTNEVKEDAKKENKQSLKNIIK